MFEGFFRMLWECHTYETGYICDTGCVDTQWEMLPQGWKRCICKYSSQHQSSHLCSKSLHAVQTDPGTTYSPFGVFSCSVYRFWCSPPPVTSTTNPFPGITNKESAPPGYFLCEAFTSRAISSLPVSELIKWTELSHSTGSAPGCTLSLSDPPGII